MQLQFAEGEVNTEPGFFATVRERCGQPIELCFQCQKCTAGCPVVEYADITPHQVIRLVYLDVADTTLASSMIWLCSACETCGARCPNGIRISEVNDTLRQMSAAARREKEKRTATFHRMFLADVQNRGRVHESMLMARFKLKTGDLFSDLDLGLQLFRKGKLPLLASGVKDKKGVREIFKRVDETRRKKGDA